jgi:hypothetical protein
VPRPPSPVALLVVRVWLEGPPTEPRIQVRSTMDVAHGFDETASFGDPESACAQVRRCLKQFIASGDNRVTGQ